MPVLEGEESKCSRAWQINGLFFENETDQRQYLEVIVRSMYSIYTYVQRPQRKTHHSILFDRRAELLCVFCCRPCIHIMFTYVPAVQSRDRRATNQWKTTDRPLVKVKLADRIQSSGRAFHLSHVLLLSESSLA